VPLDDVSTVRLGDLFNPIGGTIPSGVVASDVIANSSLTFTNTANYKWDDTTLKFNIQGQKWESDIRASIFGPQNYGAARNAATPRTYSAPAFGIVNNHFQHITELEFVFTGSKLSIGFYNSGGSGTDSNGDGTPDYGGDIQVYLEWGGRMWRAKDNPLTTTRTDGSASWRNITFTNPYHGRVRIHMGACAFAQIRVEQSAIVAPSPPRFFAIADGDSYFESSQALDADSTTGWFCSSIVDFLFEKTGFVFARRGQGATGFFSNGTGFINDDTQGSASNGLVSMTGVSRFLSSSRTNWMTQSVAVMAAAGKSFKNHAGEDFGQPLGQRPLFYLLNGTWNDASVGGVTQSQMYTRAKACYQWLQTTDPYCTFLHVSPEPFDDTLFSGSNPIGAPAAGNKNDIHVQGQVQAVAEVPRTHYINAFGPTNPWWTGYGPATTGAQGVPTNSQQAQLVSYHDAIHATKHGYEFYAGKIADAMADIRIPRARAEGLA
jgi:hypothetical protein